MAFWGTFNINGLEHIEISDIIKTFIYPFFSATFIYIISILLQDYFIDFIAPHGEGRETKIGKRLNSKVGIAISLIIWLIVSVIFWKLASTTFWGWFYWAFIVSSAPYFILDRFGVFDNLIKNIKVRLNILRVIVFVPALSFAAGKNNSELIQKNIKYKYTIAEHVIENKMVSKTDTLKLIGNSDQQYFFTDLKNSFILIIKADKVDTLILKQHN